MPLPCAFPRKKKTMATSTVNNMAKAVERAEIRHSHKLSESDRHILHNALCDFVNRAADKFVLGAKANVGDLVSRPLFDNLSDELIDAWMYKTALEYKVRRV